MLVTMRITTSLLLIGVLLPAPVSAQALECEGREATIVGTEAGDNLIGTVDGTYELISFQDARGSIEDGIRGDAQNNLFTEGTARIGCLAATATTGCSGAATTTAPTVVWEPTRAGMRRW